MSASREKNKRKELADSAVSEVKEAGKKGMSKGLKTAIAIVCAVAVIAMVVFFSMLTGGYFERNATAAVVGGHKLTPAMVNYFYKDAYSNMKSSYGDFLSYMIDESKPLDEQVYDEETGETWADVIIEEGLANAASAYAIYDEAQKANYSISETDELEIENSLNMYDLYASSYGYSNTDQFLAAYFGKGCNMKNFREYSKIITTATNYAAQIHEGFTYDSAALKAEYEANPNDYEAVTYRVFSVTDSMFTSGDEEEEVDEDALAAQEEAMASEMAESCKGDEQAFIDAAYENATEANKETYSDESATLRKQVNYSACHSELADWLFDAARAEGDTTYVESSAGYYVAYFISRSDNDFPMVNVRHILAKVEADATDEEKQDKFGVLEGAMEEYNADPTEDKFAELAGKYSEDGSAVNGGLMENVAPGQTVTNFNDWIYDENRQPGDTDIIETEYGYHAMYFVGTGDNYRDHLVENALRTADYNAWYEPLAAAYTYEKAAGMKYVTK